MSAEDWCTVVWSDEMSVCKLDGRSNTWVFRTPQEKWNQECIEPVSNSSRVGRMFWGCFVGRHRGGFTSLIADEERTGKRGITGEIILDAYKKHLPGLFDRHLDLVLCKTTLESILVNW